MTSTSVHEQDPGVEVAGDRLIIYGVGYSPMSHLSEEASAGAIPRENLNPLQIQIAACLQAFQEIRQGDRARYYDGTGLSDSDGETAPEVTAENVDEYETHYRRKWSFVWPEIADDDPAAQTEEMKLYGLDPQVDEDRAIWQSEASPRERFYPVVMNTGVVAAGQLAAGQATGSIVES